MLSPVTVLVGKRQTCAARSSSSYVQCAMPYVRLLACEGREGTGDDRG